MRLKTLDQNGNVLLVILIAIALFALLTVTLSDSFDGEDTLDEDRARVRVAHILEQETIIRNAYKMLRVANDCSVSEINFSYTADPTYNTNAPASGKCSLYHANGGALDPIEPLEDTQNTLDNAYEEFWIETSGLEVDGLGTTDSGTASCPGCDLAILLYNVDDTVCERLNLGTTGFTTIYTLAGGEEIDPRAYDGTFSNDNLIDAADDAELVEQRSFCVQEGGGDTRNVYVSILEVR